LHDHHQFDMENKTWFGDHGRSAFHHVASSEGLQLCQLNDKLQLEARETCTLYLGSSATWRSDWSFLVVPVLHHKRHVQPIRQAKWTRHARRALCLLVEDVALMVLIIRLARWTDFYVLSFLPLPFSTSRSGLYPHIPPLFFSPSVTVFSSITTCTAHSDGCNICRRRQ